MLSDQLDNFILSKIEAGFHSTVMTVNSKRKTQKEKGKNRTSYRHLSKPICTKSFCYLHTIGGSKLETLVKHSNSKEKCTTQAKTRKQASGCNFDSILF